jgi:hypothetical protein
MKPLFTESEFLLAKSKDKLPFECEECHNIFYASKHEYHNAKNTKCNTQLKYCSRNCFAASQTKKVVVSCKNCQTTFTRTECRTRQSANLFCSRKCSLIYNNTHKNAGYSRSKLEIYLEQQLSLLYPDLHIDFNKKDAVGYELDIYIPSLRLAFELNGIFHYEPIFGAPHLDKIQTKDNNKFAICQNNNISLCVIDTSGQKYFKPQSSQKYLDIITNIINMSKNS